MGRGRVFRLNLSNLSQADLPYGRRRKGPVLDHGSRRRTYMRPPTTRRFLAIRASCTSGGKAAPDLDTYSLRQPIRRGATGLPVDWRRPPPRRPARGVVSRPPA